jgi:hypothetical protein
VHDEVVVLKPFFWCLSASAGLLLAIGCGGGMAQVKGKVKFKDGSDVSVLAGYTVTFESEDAKSSSIGEIGPDGTFQLSTLGQNDGAPPGKYRVVITPPGSSDPERPPPKSQIPAKYFNFDTSGLTAEIKPGRNTIELEVERVP